MGIFLEAMDLTIVKLIQPNQNAPNTYKASESQETNLPLTILSFIAVLER